MKVIVATIEIPYEGSMYAGVYTTQEKAEDAVKAKFASNDLPSDYYSSYQEITVDGPME